MCPLFSLLVKGVWSSWIISEATVSAVRYMKSVKMNPPLGLPILSLFCYGLSLEVSF